MAFKANDKQLQRLEGLPARFEGGMRQAKHLAGQHLVRTSQKGQAAGPKSGRMYGSHQASAGGEYSAPRTWGQHNSIDYRVTETGFEFGAGQDYSPYLEEGTRKMLPRPDLGNAVGDSGDDVGRLLGEHVFNFIVGGG
jgi:hypothetical protein